LKRTHRTFVLLRGILVVVLGFALMSCASMVESMVGSISSTPVVTATRASDDPLDGYVMAFKDGSIYSVGQVLTPASADTNGEAEIMDMNLGDKRWSEVFTSRPAGDSDLVVGQIVLTPYDENPDYLKTSNWYAYFITDISRKHAGIITASGYDVKVDFLRIPDREVPKSP